MAQNDLNKVPQLIIIGGSSGSLEATFAILSVLKPSFELPIVLILHRNNVADNGLVNLLSMKTHLQVKEADEKDQIEPGWLYIAPPDYHLLLETDGSISLDASEKVHYSRPSIDVSFETAAVAYGKDLYAILLSGANADGAQGLARIKENGGTVIVQDPKEAFVPYMPEKAMELITVDYVLDAANIAALLNELTS
ncbi:MAG: chemotaxis protein CheB [Ferruginibacter sp.]|nr:chemotaxis protein CheB [Ferruginibacter sp.]